MLRKLSVLVTLFLASSVMYAGSTTVVISQMYGAGGNSGATYNADYLELHNISSAAVSLDGWAIQYGSATGSTINTLSLIPNGITLQPGQYYLFAGPTGANGAALPVAADMTIANIAFAAGAGKVFLTNSQTQLSSSACPITGGSSIVDFIGYGTTANCFEGSTFAPAPSTTLADIRTNTCTDTDQNGTDFSTGTPAPHNSSTISSCVTGPPVALSLTASFTPGTVNTGSATLLKAVVTAATQPASTGLAVTADTSALGGSTTQPLYDDGSHGDATAGDGTYSFSLTVPGAQNPNTYSVNFKVTDTQARTATTSASLIVQSSSIAASSISLSTSANSAVAGAKVTFSATVTGNQSTAPTGTVTFKDGTTTLGSGTIASTVATFSTTTLGIGTHTITAVYGGDSTYPSITSSPVTVTITAAPVADFNLSISNTSIITSANTHTAQTTINVAMVNGYSQIVTFACSGLPAATRCSFSPSSLSSSGSTTLTVGIDGANNATPKSPLGRGNGTLLALGLLGLPLLLRRTRRALAGKVLGALLLGMLAIGVSGCGSNGGTAAGTNAVTVTASGGGVTHTATFNLIVQ